MLDALLVALALADLVLGSLGILDRFLDSEEPTVALGIGRSLESVLVTMNLEGELVRRGLLEIGGVGKSNDVLGMALLGLGFDKVEKTLASLAGPGGDGMSSPGLGAAEVVAQVLGRDGLVSEPEVTLGEFELPEYCVSAG